MWLTATALLLALPALVFVADHEGASAGDSAVTTALPVPDRGDLSGCESAPEVLFPGTYTSQFETNDSYDVGYGQGTVHTHLTLKVLVKRDGGLVAEGKLVYGHEFWQTGPAADWTVTETADVQLNRAPDTQTRPDQAWMIGDGEHRVVDVNAGQRSEWVDNVFGHPLFEVTQFACGPQVVGRLTNDATLINLLTPLVAGLTEDDLTKPAWVTGPVTLSADAETAQRWADSEADLKRRIADAELGTGSASTADIKALLDLVEEVPCFRPLVVAALVREFEARSEEIIEALADIAADSPTHATLTSINTYFVDFWRIDEGLLVLGCSEASQRVRRRVGEQLQAIVRRYIEQDDFSSALSVSRLAGVTGVDDLLNEIIVALRDHADISYRAMVSQWASADSVTRTKLATQALSEESLYATLTGDTDHRALDFVLAQDRTSATGGPS